LMVADTPESWDFSGQIVSLLAGLVAIVAIWLFAGLIFNWQIAWVTALLFGLSRNFAGLGADVLLDSLALCFQMWAIVFAVLATGSLRQNKKNMLIWAALIGICCGIGYLVRPESLIVVILSIFIWLGRQFRFRRSWALCLSSIAVMFFSALVCAWPYMSAIGGISKKKSLSNLMSQIVAGTDSNCGILAIANPKLAGLWELVRELFESLHPALGVAFCIWVVTWLVSRISKVSLPRQILVFPNYLGGWFLSGMLIFMLPLLLGLYCHAGYISYRHVLLLAAVMSPFAGAGVLILIEWLKIILEKLGVNAQRRNAAFYAVIIGLGLGLFFNSLRPLHHDKGAYRQAGIFAGGLCTNEQRCEILTNSAWIAHYIKQKNPNAKICVLYGNDPESRLPVELSSRIAVKYLVWANNTDSCVNGGRDSICQSFTELKHLRKFYPLKRKERNTVNVYEIMRGGQN